ncbi:hypothetical protein R1sor_019576 [Riccia sorocarpa]|uniref:Uncharacterized protein n=1 Tax=Riccia sorocarpa TaxID=122646 RepID=A0ABD3IJ53_9MARC
MQIHVVLESDENEIVTVFLLAEARDAVLKQPHTPTRGCMVAHLPKTPEIIRCPNRMMTKHDDEDENSPREDIGLWDKQLLQTGESSGTGEAAINKDQAQKVMGATQPQGEGRNEKEGKISM